MILFLTVILSPVFLSASSSASKEEISAALRNFISSPIDSAVVPQEFNFLSAVWQSEGKIGWLSLEQQDILCDSCEIGVQVAIDVMLAGGWGPALETALTNLCSLVGITQKNVCDGAIHNYAPGLLWVVNNSQPTIGGRQVCGAILGKGCGAWEEISDWSVELTPNPKPPVEQPVLPPEGSPSRKVLHLTDIHIDLNYVVGSESDCGLPMCCGGNISATNEKTAAGYWGDYKCDVPIQLVKNMLEHIKAEHGDEIDYIMLTGDYPPHDVWAQSSEFNLESAKSFLTLVRDTFPDTQVFPSIGNHEPFPCNILPGTTAGVDDTEFDPESFLTQLSEYFRGWLPEEQLETFRKTASYSFLYRPGFRVISFPSPLCLNYNFFLYADFSDPGNMLAWLAEELAAAEYAGERVHILSHVPAGVSECLGGWGREYAKIVSRFENTVVAQFHGHTHNDHFQVYYDPTGTRATNIGFISPSVSPFVDLNPAYRLYTVDSGHDDETYRILDHDTYIVDLGEANANGVPHWRKLYSGRADLEMDTMFPGDMDKLVRRLANEVDFYRKWLRYYNKDAEGKHELKWEILCELLTTTNLDKSKCDEIIGPKAN